MEKMRDKAFLNVAEVAEIMGISKSLTYDFLHNQDCPFNVVRIRSRYAIPANSFFMWYDGLANQGGK